MAFLSLIKHSAARPAVYKSLAPVFYGGFESAPLKDFETSLRKVLMPNERLIDIDGWRHNIYFMSWLR
jgi:hypothetical protein